MRIKRWRCLLAIVVVLGVVLGLSSGATQAAKHKGMKIPAESKATFMIMPELPKDNLGGDHLGYFNLQMKPGVQRSVRVQVYNPTDETIHIVGQIKDATTKENAEVDYYGSAKPNRNLLVDPGSRYVSVPKQTVLPAGATKWITINAKINHQFKGTKATAINLSAIQAHQKSAVKNAYRYAIGMVLTGQKVSSKAYHFIETPSIKTTFTKDQKAVIRVKVNNPDPMYLKHAQMKVKLQNDKWQFIQYAQTVENGKVAPSSDFNLDVLLGGKRLVAGTYRLTLTTKNDRYTKTVHRNVLITKTQAKYINRLNAAYLRNRNLILVGSTMVFIIIVGLISYSVRRARKRKRDRHAKDGQ